AGLERLGFQERIREVISPQIMLHAVGQGALGIVCADASEAVREVLNQLLHHRETSRAVRAERAFLRRLEGGCQVPIGASGVVQGENLMLEGCVVARDGSVVLREKIAGNPSAP